MTPNSRSRDPLPRVNVGVGALVLNSSSHIFLAQRGSQARNEHGFWECPGGEVRFGERLTDAIEREFQEEHAMVIGKLRLLTVVDHLLAEEGQHWVAIIYTASHLAGMPVICEPKKCAQIGWFALDALPHPLSPASQAGLQAFEQRLRHRRSHQ